MNMLRIFRLSSAALLVALSAGCSVLGGEQRDPVTVYAPQVDVATDPSWPAVRWQLSVSHPTAARVVDSPRIAVRPAPNELQVYRGASWSQPPTDLVETTVLRALEDSGKIPSVGRSGVGIRADYKLVMDLRRFEADYAGAAVPSAVIDLNAKLLHTAEQRVVASRTFVQSQPAAGTEVPQVTAAFDQALERLGAELVGWTLVSGQADAQVKR
ncbi:MAG TPA: ABC-type transport auxiliary lipoprotein family protein [Pseudoxanthomonas sp.]|nr:ABC-type transport auxiliary lipoprotein family protein [Pseudoxanthomonas sp.]